MTTTADRLVLENVPRVHFFAGGDRCPEDMPFPSCMRACLEYLGDDYGCRQFDAHGQAWRFSCGYAYFMAVSGNAFMLSWKPGWHGDNVALHNMSTDPAAPYRRAFEAAGYGYEIVHKEDGHDSEAIFRRRIADSLRRGRPVLAFGVIGPPEPSIVTGYDEGGDVLLGWNFFQHMPEFNAGVEFEPSGYFRKRNWFAETEALILIGDKGARPSLARVCRDTLQWALTVARTPQVYDRHNGFAAYDAWAAHLLRDEDFPADDLAVLAERMMVHDDAVGLVAEGRYYGSEFLRGLIGHFPALAAPLEAAAACYKAEHDLMWQVWGAVGGLGREEKQLRLLADPAIRRQIVPIIRQAKAQDEEAATHLERALTIEITD